MLLGILMVGTSEALRLGMANGMDPAVLSEVMAKSSGRNWTLEVYNPCPGVMENVPASRPNVPFGGLARSLYDVHSKAGNGQLDFSSIFKMFAPKA